MLPPIATVGLTAAEVSGLAARVHDQMLDALREISGVAAGREEGAAKADEAEAVSASPTLTDPSISSASIASSSLASSRAASERGVETEEDEGMILVGRPA